MSTHLPSENISDILDNASTLQEYRSIRESFNLKDKDIESLIKREYNRRIDLIKDEEIRMNKKYGKKYLDHLYRLKNPESKYILIFFSWEEGEIYAETIGTKDKIISYLNNQTTKFWTGYILDSETSEEYKEREKEMSDIMDYYKDSVDEAVTSIKTNGYSTVIGANHINKLHTDNNDMYILAKLK